MRTMNKIIMTLAGLLLIIAAGLKVHQMIDTCVPSWQAKAQAAVVAAENEGDPIPPQWKSTVIGIWESYEFNLFQIPLEFALGIWMVSGLFRKAAWIAGTLAYFFFIFVTLGKWFAGAPDCGCWGTIHVDPRITLFAADIPIFLLLAIFRPKGTKLLPPPWPNLFHLLAVFVPTIGLMVIAPPAMVALKPDCVKVVPANPDETTALRLQIHKLKQGLTNKDQTIAALQQAITELKQTPRSTDKKAFIGVLEVVAAETPSQYQIHIGGTQTLILNAENLEKILLSVQDAEKQKIAITETGQVEINWTEPEEIGNGTGQQVSDANVTAIPMKQWDWLEYVVEDDVRQQISEGLAIVLMHRHDCPTCAEIVPAYSKYYRQMIEQGADGFKIAFLAVPPYHEDEDTVPDDTPCILGKLTDKQKWGLMSPYVVALLNGEKVKEWPEGTAPEPENLYDEVFEALGN